LTRSDLPFSLIADGLHLHPATVRLAWQANKEGLLLISDLIGGSVATLPGSATLAGSLVPLDQAVRNLRDWTGCSAAQAIEAASFKPAQLLGLARSKGSLEFGADADFILLDSTLKVQTTYINGICFSIKLEY
jgi:N-acetylglucosamine-6-phosphate deacetylase